MEAKESTSLLIEHLVLIGVYYRHGKLSGIGIEALEKCVPLLRRGGAEVTAIVSENIRGGARRCHAMAFPVQLPVPRPSGEGAGLAIGVALP
jgi:hypothetical protein